MPSKTKTAPDRRVVVKGKPLPPGSPWTLLPVPTDEEGAALKRLHEEFDGPPTPLTVGKLVPFAAFATDLPGVVVFAMQFSISAEEEDAPPPRMRFVVAESDAEAHRVIDALGETLANEVVAQAPRKWVDALIGRLAMGPSVLPETDHGRQFVLRTDDKGFRRLYLGFVAGATTLDHAGFNRGRYSLRACTTLTEARAFARSEARLLASLDPDADPLRRIPKRVPVLTTRASVRG